MRSRYFPADDISKTHVDKVPSLARETECSVALVMAPGEFVV